MKHLFPNPRKSKKRMQLEDLLYKKFKLFLYNNFYEGGWRVTDFQVDGINDHFKNLNEVEKFIANRLGKVA